MKAVLVCGHEVEIASDGGEGVCPCIEIKHHDEEVECCSFGASGCKGSDSEETDEYLCTKCLQVRHPVEEEDAEDAEDAYEDYMEQRGEDDCHEARGC
jgi:hypothetical protein